MTSLAALFLCQSHGLLTASVAGYFGYNIPSFPQMGGNADTYMEDSVHDVDVNDDPSVMPLGSVHLPDPHPLSPFNSQDSVWKAMVGVDGFLSTPPGAGDAADGPAVPPAAATASERGLNTGILRGGSGGEASSASGAAAGGCCWSVRR